MPLLCEKCSGKVVSCLKGQEISSILEVWGAGMVAPSFGIGAEMPPNETAQKTLLKNIPEINAHLRLPAEPSRDPVYTRIERLEDNLLRLQFDRDITKLINEDVESAYTTMIRREIEGIRAKMAKQEEIMNSQDARIKRLEGSEASLNPPHLAHDDREIS